MTVYVIQDQQTRDIHTGALSSRFDISAAKEYGEFKYVLGSSVRPFNPDHALEQIRDGLHGFTEEDHLLLIGNPNFIGWTFAILTDMGINTFKTLQWNGRERAYIEIIANVFED